MQQNPSKKYFEVLAKAYLKMVNEKYLSPDKVLQILNNLQLPNTKAKSIILTAMRDATRQTSLELYGNSNKKRQDILNAIMGALKKLENPEKEKKLKGRVPKKG